MSKKESSPHRGREVAKKAAKTGATLAAFAGAYAAIGAADITMRNHREKTHRSLEIHPWVAQIFDTLQRTYGGHPIEWAAVHRIHHSATDASLAPFWRINRALEWLDNNPDHAEIVKVPEKFPHLDPFVESFSEADVRGIGKYADNLLRKRLGDTYEEPGVYKPQELRKLLNPTEPQYFYPTEQHKGPYTQDDIAEILLGDPHSPVRVRKNGVRGVIKDNYTYYKNAGDLFREKPHLKEKDLRDEKSEKPITRKDYMLGVAVPAAAVFLMRGEWSPVGAAKAVAAGAVIDAGRIAYLLAGGNVVNSLGHAGELNQRLLAKALREETFKPRVKPDGSVTTDAVDAGFIGRALSWATLDEVGGQDQHHLYPGNIAYTSEKGWKAWRDAPWGMTLKTLAESKYFPLLKPGKGFDLKPGEVRPDMPNDGLQIIHQRRREQLALQETTR